MRPALRLLLIGVTMLTAAAGAHADVFEIGSDGAVRIRSGGGAVVWQGGSDVELSDTAEDGSMPDVPQDALTALAAPEAPALYQPALLDAAKRYDVSPSLLAALVWQESRWRPTAVSNKGAVGLAQLMPATARALAVDPRDPGANLSGAARYLRQMLDLFDGDVERALAAYNAGPQRVLRAGGVPAIPETRAYVSTIIDRLAAGGPDQTHGVTR